MDIYIAERLEEKRRAQARNRYKKKSKNKDWMAKRALAAKEYRKNLKLRFR